LKLKKFFVYFFLLSFFLSFAIAPKSQAITLGDAALVVAVSAGTGAILGASTLPFYSDPSANKKNIFYGASFGAVIGVLISAYSGFQESAKEEMDTQNLRLLNPENTYSVLAKPTSLMQSQQVLVYAPATVLRF